MRLSARIRNLKPSATLAINAKAQELRSQGRNIVSLAVGEPDFPTPEHVCRAAVEAVEQGFTRYTPVPGIPELRAAAAAYFGRFYDASAGPDNILISNGGKQCLYNLFASLLDPGDEVLVPSPYWVSYPPMIELCGARCVPVPTEAENGYLVMVRDLEAHATPRTRMLLLNTPSNPTGGHYAQQHLDELIAWALAKGLFVMSDEVYDRLVFSPGEPSSASRWLDKAPDRIAVVNALSKTFAMTGWRVGFALAHPDLIKAASRIQSQTTSNICSIAQKAGLAALTGPWDLVDTMRAAFATRRDAALSRIAAWPGVVCPRPDGAFYLFPRVDACYTEHVPDSTTLCTRILEKEGIALVPGAAFGDDRCIRISYALSEETLASALDRIAALLARLD